MYICCAFTWPKIHICIKYINVKANIHLIWCIFTRGVYLHVQINFYIYAIAFTCPKIRPGANYTYTYNLHTVCKSAHVNRAIVTLILTFILKIPILEFCCRFENSNENVTICCIDYLFYRSVKCQSLKMHCVIYCFHHQISIIHTIRIHALYT